MDFKIFKLQHLRTKFRFRTPLLELSNAESAPVTSDQCPNRSPKPDAIQIDLGVHRVSALTVSDWHSHRWQALSLGSKISNLNLRLNSVIKILESLKFEFLKFKQQKVQIKRVLIQSKISEFLSFSTRTVQFGIRIYSKIRKEIHWTVRFRARFFDLRSQ